MTDARFGEKVYADVAAVAGQAAEKPSESLTSAVAAAFTNSVLDTVKEIAKESSVTVAQAEQVVKQNANVLAREVEMVRKQAEIREAEATAAYFKEKAVAAATNDPHAVAEVQARYEAAKREIVETLHQDLADRVSEKQRN
jgi:hypothetical protein